MASHVEERQMVRFWIGELATTLRFHRIRGVESAAGVVFVEFGLEILPIAPADSASVSTVSTAMRGPSEDGGNGEHGDDGEHFENAAVERRGEETFGQLGLQRKLGENRSDFGDSAFCVESCEGIERFEGANEGLGGRGRHEVELGEVLNAEAFEHENGGSDVASENFGSGLLLERRENGSIG